MATSMHQRVLLQLAIVILCTAGSNTQQSLFLRLVPDDLSVQANASCCPVNGSQPCKEQECPATTDLPNIVDGNAFTEWMVNFVSDNGPRVEFSFDFKQVYINSHSCLYLHCLLFCIVRLVVIIKFSSDHRFILLLR